MDLILDAADTYLIEPAGLYQKAGLSWAVDDWRRQSVSIFLIVLINAYILYFASAGLSYRYLFDHKLREHPKFQRNQEWKEIGVAAGAMPWMTLLTLPIFLAEVRGHSKLYSSVDEFGWAYFGVSVFMFLMFNDCLIYWIHRAIHHPLLYKHIHKEHHRWLVPTPFASHAFHPLDGFVQSCPYHIFIFLFPLHKVAYLGLFVLVNFCIHDGEYQVPKSLEYYVNGAAHHTDHHLYYSYNLGQYFTLWDRIGGTYREPSPFLGKGPHDDVIALRAKKEQSNQQGRAGGGAVAGASKSQLGGQDRDTKKAA
eukprot:g1274.t1